MYIAYMLYIYVIFYILLADQISLPDCLYFLRYWTISILQVLLNQGVTL